MSSARRWFILENNQVNGPYDPSEVERLVANSSAGALIWGKGLPEWLPATQWREALKDPNYQETQAVQEPLWRYRLEGQESQPMPFDEMIATMKKLTDYTDIQVWNDSQKEWSEIYLVAKVCDMLGVSRRVHPRVPIMGTLQVETPRGPAKVKVISVSEGGLGVSEATMFKIGEKYKSVLTSPNLFVTINCQIEVMYVGSEGYSGLRFVNLPIEAKSALIEYVNKFKELPK